MDWWAEIAGARKDGSFPSEGEGAGGRSWRSTLFSWAARSALAVGGLALWMLLAPPVAFAQACPSTIDFGATIECSLDSSGEVDTFTFTGAQGDTVRVRAIGTSGTLTVSPEVVQTDGTVCRASLGSEVTCLLVGAGAHTIRVRGVSRTGTGIYRLYLQRLNNPVGCTAVLFGTAARAASLDVIGETDCFTLEGAASDRVRLRVRPTSGTLVVVSLEVVQPSGATLCESGLLGTATMNELTCPLRVNGRHTVLVADAFSSASIVGGIYYGFGYPFGPGTGGYNLFLQRLNNPVGCIDLAFGAAPAAGSIDPAGEVDCYRFPGLAQDRVRVQPTAIFSPAGTPPGASLRLPLVQAEVLRPDGSTVCRPPVPFAAPVPPTGELTCLLDAGGTHTVLLGESLLSGSPFGSPYGSPYGSPSYGPFGPLAYAVYLQRLSNPVGCGPLALGAAGAPGSIDLPGEVDCFTFTGVAGDRVRLWAVGTAGLPTADLEVVQTDGTTVCGPSFFLRGSGGAAAELSCVLVSAGRHTVLLGQGLAPYYRGYGYGSPYYGGYPYYGSPTTPQGPTTGRYLLYGQRLNSPIGCSPIPVGGAPSSGSIDASGEMDCFTFSGAINDRVRVRAVATSTRLTATVEVVQPDGVSCSTSPYPVGYGSPYPGPPGFGGTGDAICLLERSGTHAIFVRISFSPLLGSGTGRYHVHLQRLNNPTGCASIAYGATATGSIDTNAELDCFTFNGTANDRVRVRVATPLTARVEIWQPGGTPLCESTTSRPGGPLPPP